MGQTQPYTFESQNKFYICLTKSDEEMNIMSDFKDFVARVWGECKLIRLLVLHWFNQKLKKNLNRKLQVISSLMLRLIGQKCSILEYSSVKDPLKVLNGIFHCLVFRDYWMRQMFMNVSLWVRGDWKSSMRQKCRLFSPWAAALSAGSGRDPVVGNANTKYLWSSSWSILVSCKYQILSSS